MRGRLKKGIPPESPLSNVMTKLCTFVLIKDDVSQHNVLWGIYQKNAVRSNMLKQGHSFLEEKDNALKVRLNLMQNKDVSTQLQHQVYP